jgi:hypothetical protein
MESRKFWASQRFGLCFLEVLFLELKISLATKVVLSTTLSNGRLQLQEIGLHKALEIKRRLILAIMIAQ